MSGRLSALPIGAGGLSRRRFLALIAALAAAPAVSFEPRRAFAASVTRTVLENGLSVLVEERPTAETLAVHVAARAGSRDDASLPGLTVLTSRVMFQGTSRRPSETDVQRAAALVGGTVSRGTDPELSALAALVPAFDAEVAFDLLADLLQDALFLPEALERQRTIARQDLARRRADPGSLLADLFQANLYAGHPLGSPIIGTAESLGSIDRASLLAQRERLWGANNLVLVVVGRIQPDYALELAEQYFSGLAPGSANQRLSLPVGGPARPQTVTGQVGQQQAQFRLGFAAPSVLHDDRYAMTVLNAIMGGGDGRMFEELRSNRGLAYAAGANYQVFSDAGAWYVGAGVAPENVAPALQVARAEIERLRAEVPPEDEVGRRISQITGREILASETNAARASQLAARELLGAEPAEEFVQRVRQVTPPDVQRVAQRYLDPNRSLFVVVGPPR